MHQQGAVDKGHHTDVTKVGGKQRRVVSCSIACAGYGQRKRKYKHEDKRNVES